MGVCRVAGCGAAGRPRGSEGDRSGNQPRSVLASAARPIHAVRFALAPARPPSRRADGDGARRGADTAKGPDREWSGPFGDWATSVRSDHTGDVVDVVVGVLAVVLEDADRGLGRATGVV